MKRFWYIIPVILVVTSACSSLRFTGATNDDLYYRPSEAPVTVVAAEDRNTGQYYDNIFAADTLIADEYIPDNEYEEYAATEATVINNYYGSPSERIYLFNDYFHPYWRDPFYYSPFSVRLNFGYGYSPYYYGYDPFYYDPFYYDWYSPYSYYRPYYSYWGGYPNYYGYNYYGYNNYYPGIQATVILHTTTVMMTS